MCDASLNVMQVGIDASPLFGRPNSDPFSRRGTRSFRRQGWVDGQDGSRCVLRATHRRNFPGCFERIADSATRCKRSLVCSAEPIGDAALPFWSESSA